MRGKLFKVFLICALVSAALVTAVVCTGCGIIRYVKKIEIKDDKTYTFYAGKYDLSDVVVIATYSDGKKEEIELTEDMIPSYELTKFYKIGEQAVEIRYEKVKCELHVEILMNQFDDDLYFDSATYTYDGKPHSVAVSGNIPEKAQIKYPNGNTFINAGKYKVTAVLVCDGYESKTLESELTINKAVFDESQIVFKDQSFTYDGDSKIIKAENISDDEVTAVYEIYGSDGKTRIEEAVNAGVYIERLRLVFKNDNYLPVADREAKLTIEKASYDIGNIPFASQTVTYDQKTHTLVISDPSKVPIGIGVTYEIYKADGLTYDKCMSVPLTDLKKTDRAQNAGVYLFVAKFEGNNPNYGNLPSKRAVLTIEKAKIQAPDLTLPSLVCKYDGNTHSLKVSGTLPSGVKVTYTYNGVTTAGVKTAGTYTVVANLQASDKQNYAVSPSTLTATLIINSASEN